MAISVVPMEMRTRLTLADGTEMAVDGLRLDVSPRVALDPSPFAPALPPSQSLSFEMRGMGASELFRALQVEQPPTLRLTVDDAPRLPLVRIDPLHGVYRVFFNGRKVCSRRRRSNAVRVAATMEAWARAHRPPPVRTSSLVQCVAVNETERGATFLFNTVGAVTRS